jgi:hypothetical protein
LFENTSEKLNDLSIEYKDSVEKENGKYYKKVGAESLVYKGLSYLSDSWDLNDLIDIVTDWREQLWLTQEK